MNLEEFNNIVKCYKSSYGMQIKDLKKKYELNISKLSIVDFKEFTSCYRNIIIKMIIELSKIFFKDYKYNVIIALTGSMARCTNTLYSDIDVNFLTDANDFKEIIDIEDKINYVLQNVVEFRGRDRIHTMVVYLPLVSNIEYDFILKNKYPIKLEDSTIYFQCRRNAEKLMFGNYNSTRNIYDVIKYFNENDTCWQLNEWSNCFKVILNNRVDYVYEKHRTIYRDCGNIVFHIDNCIKAMKNDYNIIVNNSEIENFKLKQIYKSKVLFNIYNMLAIYYRYDNTLKCFDICELEYNSKLLSKDFFEKFYQYLISIQNLQLVLDKINLDLTSHSDEIINLKMINCYYKKISKRESIINELNKNKKELYDISIKHLEKLRSELL